MEFLKNLFVKIFAKKVVDSVGEEKWAASKTKLVAVISVLLYAIQNLGPAFGHVINIPPDVYKVLAALGLWTLRDALPPKPL